MSAEDGEDRGIEDVDLFSAIQIDDTLEDRLMMHGISKRNMRSMIFEVFSDENVLKLLNTKDDELELDFPDVPRTRSKCQRENNALEDLFEDSVNEWTISDQSAFTDAAELGTSFHEDNETHLTAEETNDTSQEWTMDTCNDSMADFDWHTWLAEFNDEKQAKEGDDDSENDPDFNFLAELEEIDAEDFRIDNTTRISKKELKSLADDAECVDKQDRSTLVNHTVNATETNARDLSASQGSSHDKKNGIALFLQCKTLKEKLELLRKRPELKSISESSIRRKKKSESKGLILKPVQKELIRQQMQQHVQLLAQTCVLQSNDTEYFNQSQEFLNELNTFGHHSPDQSTSFFNAINLTGAVELIDNLNSKNLVHGDESELTFLNRNQMQIISNSPVFMYRELLPQCENYGKKNSSQFSIHEDCLITYGLNEMSGLYLSACELISSYMMPVHSPTNIKKRISLVLRSNTYKAAHNPISTYKMFGRLPPRCDKVQAVSPCEIRKPIDMDGNIPDWLILFKQKSSEYMEEFKAKDGQERKRKVKRKSSEYLGEFKLKDGPGRKRKVESKRSELPENVSAKNVKMKRDGTLKSYWTRSMDEKILNLCKKYGGPTPTALSVLAKTILGRSEKKIESRFYELLQIYYRKSKLKPIK